MIYLVRHGQTEFNRERRYQGHLDSPLTDLGRQQARMYGERFAGLIVKPADWTIFTSPQGRAMHSAEIIRDTTGIPNAIRPDPRLREVSLGSWDGLTDEDVDAQSPGARAGPTRFDWFFVSPDGDRYDLFKARLAEGLAAVIADPAPNKIIVSHGVAGRVLRGLYAGLDKDEALKLDAPQTAFFRLAGGTIDRIDCDPAASATLASSAGER